MRHLPVFVIAIAAVSLGAGRAQAQNYPWCAQYDKGDDGMNCGFTSFQQCLDDVRGIGGFCEQNNTYRPPAAARPAERRTRKHHPHS
jgi:Protein of unknown function (DUF3551)